MTDQLTEVLFSQEWYRHTSGLFFPLQGLKTNPPGSGPANLAKCFLRALRDHAERYLSARVAGNVKVNYEDLFSMAETIKHDVIRARLRPEVGDFVNAMTEQTRNLWQSLGDNHWQQTGCDQLASLTDDAMGLIQGAVRSLLEGTRPARGFQALRALLADSATIDHIDLVTLNHDLLVESELLPTDYCDGFVDRDGDVLFYNDASFFTDSRRIFLLKPHGSINWYRLRKDAQGGPIDRYGKLDPAKDPWHQRQANGAWFDNLSGEPVFLTGLNKLPRYATGIFARQVNWVRRFLEKTERVVCSGYGWKDEGMNNLLLEWLDSSAANRLVLLHKDEALFQDARSPLSFRRHDLKSSGKLLVIPKWLSCCKDSSEILPALN